MLLAGLPDVDAREWHASLVGKRVSVRVSAYPFCAAHSSLAHPEAACLFVKAVFFSECEPYIRYIVNCTRVGVCTLYTIKSTMHI